MSTAAHCLPNLPPAHWGSYTKERTFLNLLGPLDSPATLSTQCVFADPIADVAVLAAPDSQIVLEMSEAYDTFTKERPTLHVGGMRGPRLAWLLTLERRWQLCSVRRDFGNDRTLELIGAGGGCVPGCSGSPILTDEGLVVGVVGAAADDPHVEGDDIRAAIEGKADQHAQPHLAMTLPGWLLAELHVDTFVA